MREAAEPEGEAGTDFPQGLIVYAAATQADVESDVVTYLPDRADQNRTGFRAAEVPLVEELGNRPNLPVMRTLDDRAESEVGMLLARQSDLRVEMHGEPGPALRHDRGSAGA